MTLGQEPQKRAWTTKWKERQEHSWGLKRAGLRVMSIPGTFCFVSPHSSADQLLPLSGECGCWKSQSLISRHVSYQQGPETPQLVMEHPKVGDGMMWEIVALAPILHFFQNLYFCLWLWRFPHKRQTIFLTSWRCLDEVKTAVYGFWAQALGDLFNFHLCPCSLAVLLEGHAQASSWGPQRCMGYGHPASPRCTCWAQLTQLHEWSWPRSEPPSWARPWPANT